MEKPNSNTFEITLRECRNGGAVHDASSALAEVVAGVRQTGRGGSLTIRLNIKPPAKGVGMVVVEDEIIPKVPKEPSEGTMFYWTENNSLQRHDPRQRELNLKELPKETAEVREVAVNQ